MPRMDKKGVLGNTVSLVLMLIVLGLSLFACSKYVGTDQTKKSFDELVEVINELKTKEPETSRVMPIYLNEETMILGFNEGQDKISVFKGEEYIKGNKIGKKTYLVFRKPSKCGKKSCLCYSRKLLASDGPGYEGSSKIEHNDKIEYVFEFLDNNCVKNVFDTEIKTHSKQKGLRKNISKRDYRGLVIDSDIAKAPTVLPQHDRESAVRITIREEGIAVNTGLIYEKDILK